MKNRRFLLALGVLFLLVPLTLLPAQAQSSLSARKARIAVLDFDYAIFQSKSAAIFGADVDLGKGICNLLVKDLVKDGTYSVIERKELDKILTEQNFSSSDRVNPNSAAKIGRLLGADAIVIGSITQFGKEDAVSAADRGRVLHRTAPRSAKAVAGLRASLVSVDTAAILAVVESRGESTRENTSSLGGGDWHGWGGKTPDFGRSDFQQTIIGEATRQATEVMATGIVNGAGKIEKRIQPTNATN